MTFLDGIKKAAKSSNKDYTAFIRTYHKAKDTIHLFYEGFHDPAFYASALRQVISGPRKILFHRASNKSEVYRYYKLIDWRSYSRKRVLFVVDKDFADVLGIKYPTAPNIYVTEFYSIENYVVDEDTLERLVIEHCRGNDPELVENVRGLFRQSYLEFVRNVKPIIAYIIYHKRNGGATQLNNIDLQHLITIRNQDLLCSSNSSPNGQGKVEYLDNRVQVITPQGAWKSILQELRLLDGFQNHKIWLRGKFDIWFFIKFVQQFIRFINRETDMNIIDPQLHQGNAMMILAPLSDKPRSLLEFLDERIN